MRKYSNSILFLLVIVILAAVLGVSCRPADYSEVTDGDIYDLKGYVLSSYYMLGGNAESGLSRATVPVWNMDQAVSFSDGSGTLTDYPETGQNSTWSAEAEGSDIYKITVTTDYTNNDAIDNTVEVYYVKDVTPGDSLEDADIADSTADGEWTSADPVVDPADGTVDNLYRDTFETTFTDGSVRYEEIVATSSGDSPVHYAAFSFDDFTDVPDTAFTPVTDAAAQYSSRVDYQQEIYKKFAFWNVLYKRIIGTRYYTEFNTADGIVSTSISFERVIERNTQEEKGRGSIIQALKDALYEPDTLDIEDATLAENIIWYEIDAADNKEIKVKSYVVNDFGDNFSLTAEDGSDPAISAATDTFLP